LFAEQVMENDCSKTAGLKLFVEKYANFTNKKTTSKHLVALYDKKA
jgi:hypothetical protein